MDNFLWSPYRYLRGKFSKTNPLEKHFSEDSPWKKRQPKWLNYGLWIDITLIYRRYKIPIVFMGLINQQLHQQTSRREAPTSLSSQMFPRRKFPSAKISEKAWTFPSGKKHPVGYYLLILLISRLIKHLWLGYIRRSGLYLPRRGGVLSHRGTPKSSIFVGCSLVNHPFLGIPIYGNPHIGVSCEWSL